MPIVGASISLLCILVMFGLPWVGSTWASFWIQKPIKSKSFKNIQNEKQCSIILINPEKKTTIVYSSKH